MPAWTPAERRGALLVALLLSLGAARDLWRAAHPRIAATPPPTADASGAGTVSGGLALPQDTGRSSPDAAPLVDLNQAGLAELDALPGIGPVLAGRILQRRNVQGPFREPEDLLSVPGIGPRLFERLRPRIRVGPPRSPAAGPASHPGGPAP